MSDSSAPRRIERVLVANRGEIACRIMRTCRAMGLSTVAVYSDADAHAMHVALADHAEHIGPSPSSESYLAIDKVIAAAKRSCADAVHPGYGFLSENAEFARRCIDAGLVFIGPTPHAIAAMGSKIGAKQLLCDRKSIPLIPGTVDAIGSSEEVRAEARRLGLPVLLKASAGGGGKGMRVVHREEELERAVDEAQSEAQASFGDPKLLLEKYFGNVKHIEVQIVGDLHGNVRSLFERECSVQRRHQKVIEEAPSSGVVTEEIRRRICAAAVEIGEVIRYSSLGTVEFILDCSTGNFYFLEVNTRLQVEHPVTEAITGLDLVRLQIQIAQGGSLDDEALGVRQAAIKGHAVECRLCAEDPNNNFFPSVGRVRLWQPLELPGVRYDTGIQSGSEISVFYDPMLSKIIAYGETREEAVRLLERALEKTVVMGVSTNISFLLWTLRHPSFRDGSFTTHFIENYFTPQVRTSILQSVWEEHLDKIGAAAALFEWEMGRRKQRHWRSIPSGWRNNPSTAQTRMYSIEGGEPITVLYRHQSSFRHSGDSFMMQIGKNGPERRVQLVSVVPPADPRQIQAPLPTEMAHLQLSCSIEGQTLDFQVCSYEEKGTRRIAMHNSVFGHIRLECVSKFFISAEDLDSDDGNLVAEMPARILEILVQEGQKVEKDRALLVIESMKMQTRLLASRPGTVHVYVKQGDLVEAGTIMVAVEK